MARLGAQPGGTGSAGIIADIDGTICPIAPRPDEARIDTRTLGLLAQLVSNFCLVALLSGRSVEEMVAMAPVPGLVMIGNHGMESLIDGVRRDASEAAPYRDRIEQLAERLAGDMEHGVILQPKGLSISLHYRLAADPDAARAHLLDVLEPVLDAGGLRLQEGKRVIDVRPDCELDKGTALADLIDRYRLRTVAVFGDDETDVAAFERLSRLRDNGLVDGVSVAVVSEEAAPEVAAASDLQVDGPTDVVDLLEELACSARSSASLS